MKKVLFSVAAAALLGLGLAASPASAAPTGPVQIDRATSDITQVRMTKRQMTRQRMMRRSGMSSRRVMRGGDPNARNPNRPPMQQNTGQTTGGPRY